MGDAGGEGAGWRQAALLWSADGGASWTEAGATAAPGIVGRVEQASAVAIGIDQPPAQPVEGSAWVVGRTPTGAWAGRADALAIWTAGGWRFVAAREGMAVWNLQASVPARFVDGRWENGTLRSTRVSIGGRQVIGPRQGAIVGPAGGSVIDEEARAGIAAILAALRGHGLIDG